MYVTKETFAKYPNIGWTLQQIKEAHDNRVHTSKYGFYECTGCPECKHCRCPVPLDEHTHWYETP